MIQSVQTTINNCIWVEAFLIMYAKSTTLTKQNSVSVTGPMRIEAPPKHDQKTSKARCSCDGNPAKYNGSLIRRIRSRIYRCVLCKNTFDSYANLQKSYNGDPFSQNNREAAR